MIRRPRRPTLFPHPPLFRSRSPAAREAYRRAGALVDESTQMVRLGRDLVEAHLAHAPERFVLHARNPGRRSEEHTSELQSQSNLVCRLLLEKKKAALNEQSH